MRMRGRLNELDGIVLRVFYVEPAAAIASFLYGRGNFDALRFEINAESLGVGGLVGDDPALGKAVQGQRRLGIGGRGAGGGSPLVAKQFSAVLHDSNARVLDLCCGTGDLAFAFRRESASGAEITGSDFVPEMLVRARAKSDALGAKVEFMEADALALPFVDASFDLVSCAFGFRNLANYDRGLQEILRVLKPSGSAAIWPRADLVS